jgi:hypothetical protein
MMDMIAPTKAALPLPGRALGRHVAVEHVWKAHTPGTYVVRDVTFTL